MTKADSVHSTPPTNTPAVPTRRRFLSQAAGVAIGGAAVAAVATKAVALPLDDSALVKLEEQIFEQYEGAAQYDDEIDRLAMIWHAESKRRLEAAEGSCLSQDERWKLATDMDACREHSRLAKLQDPFYARMDALVKQMFAIPAHTAEGRRAKATVLLGCILGDDWRRADEETEYPERMARSLLIEFIGGEPGEMLRGQFA
jgi:hypothetical protein